MYFLYIVLPFIVFPCNADEIKGSRFATYHITLFVNVVLRKLQNKKVLHVHFCTKSLAKYLAVISFFTDPQVILH